MTYAHKTSASRPALTPVAMRLVAASLLVAGLAGCRDHWGSGREMAFEEPVQTYQERHPIVVDKAATDLALPVSGDWGLNTYQKNQAAHFIGLWRHEGAGRLMISGTSRAAMNDVKDLLADRKVPSGAIELVGHSGQPGVKLSFLRYVAQGPDCGIWPKSVTEDRTNQNFENFGCSYQHNIAAQVANPRDLVVPRATDDWRDGDRRDKVFAQYWIGDTTAAKKSSEEKSGNISDVAKQ